MMSTVKTVRVANLTVWDKVVAVPCQALGAWVVGRLDDLYYPGPVGAPVDTLTLVLSVLPELKKYSGHNYCDYFEMSIKPVEISVCLHPLYLVTTAPLTAVCGYLAETTVKTWGNFYQIRKLSAQTPCLHTYPDYWTQEATWSVLTV